ncbi:merR HTH regulatory family protein [Anoxybacillus sp. B7M1]|jgi:DNA-binding transcriptional MerR regulator|uniref:MerR family transcriptional regulator n=1 Tax=unclassified Anoxybacillus TaxID=2639704 RepID=UPI00069853CB|nr:MULTISPECIES: MerR family transcriptional regulator [unclassified Anoxybacillus]ANB58257.1 merR HTH regulatory family protein [Anoxybacillus sp. B2M1]ANB65461.1 merR HTH regulatory family protein [Anoxybacillus sp. B7M1]
MKTYSISEIAKKTGVSIRTLRYYDEIGLLQPAKAPSSGHRMYTEEDIVRLYKIMSLKFIGLRLDEIRQYIDQPTYDLSLKETRSFCPHQRCGIRRCLIKRWGQIISVFYVNSIYHSI